MVDLYKWFHIAYLTNLRKYIVIIYNYILNIQVHIYLSQILLVYTYLAML